MPKLSATSLVLVALVVSFSDGGHFADTMMETLQLHNASDHHNDSGACADTITLNGKNIYHAVQQTFFVNTAAGSVYKGPTGYCVATLEKSDYVIRPGIGAHKLFKHKVTWNTAREICRRDGGHLAVVDSAEEERVFRSWMTNETLDGVWLGIHDLFEQGSWVTLAGDPVAAMSYYPWAQDEPNNWHDEQHCGILWLKLKTSGISDTACHLKQAFVCEISLCEVPNFGLPATRVDEL